MSRNINVKIQDYQVEKIKRSGLTYSEFVRRAIDYYDEDIRTAVFMEILDYCKESVKISKEDVKNKFISVENTGKETVKGKEYLYENKDKIYSDKDKIYGGKGKTGEIATNDVARKLKDKLPMLQRVLNNPENLNSLPDFTVKTLIKEINVSKQSLNNFIEEYKTLIKEGKFDEIV